ncbi:MAG: pseudouridine synthase [Candidatus Saccharicenans sp.]|nr:pseudouridine synthase [Candidatus Saccharicenans sp.]
MRLNKLLSMAGVASRREADRLIEQGRVKVNGQVVTQLGVKVDENKDRVEVDDRPVRLSQEKVYLILNKPEGYRVAQKSAGKYRSVFELLPRLPVRIYPVGHMDSETEGLLLFTNDGELTHRLTHPRYEVKKVYEIRVKGYLEDEELQKLEKGAFVDGRRIVPEEVRLVYRNRERSLFTLKLHEWRKYDVRRMMLSLGLKVKKVRRVCYAGLTVKGLRRGFWRYLTLEEIENLRECTGLLK